MSGKALVYVVRGLRKTPGFAVAALAILTLGIGANTAIFGIVDAVFLKPLPFPNPDSSAMPALAVRRTLAPPRSSCWGLEVHSNIC